MTAIEMVRLAPGPLSESRQGTNPRVMRAKKCSALSYGDYMTPKVGAKNRGGVWREQ